MNTVRLYLRSMGILLKSQLQYPLSFLLQTLAQLIMEGGEMLAVVLLVDRFDRLNQWTAGDLYFFFGLMSATFYITECFGRGITGNFPSMVRTGQLDTLLIRPRAGDVQRGGSASDHLHCGRNLQPDSGEPVVPCGLDDSEYSAAY